MSILSSLYTSVAGLGAHGKAIDVVSDNVANVNTVGFKAARGRFEDVMAATVASGSQSGQAGQGARLAGIDQLFNQGALLGTGVATDLAIEGDGFFVVDGRFEGVSGQFFTRAGQFNLDATGRMLNPQGLAVQGYSVDATGTMGTALGDIVIPPFATVPPNTTTTAEIAVNLDGTAAVPAAFDVNNPGTTSNYSTSLTVYDSLGAGHNVDLFFRHNGGGAWEWHALVDGGELTGGTAGTATEVANGNLTFTTTGALDTEVVTTTDFDFIGAVQNQAIAFDFGDAITTDAGTGRAGSTGYAAASSVSTIQQNGYSSGALAGIGISDDGRITGTFTNGERRVVGQVALARFRNNTGLVRAGAGMFFVSDDSGLPLIGEAGTGGRGVVAAASLEQSNVDLAQEFVNLISFQRGFQASSRTVSTADEMLGELVNLKR